jgi:hypothetical protein
VQNEKGWITDVVIQPWRVDGALSFRARKLTALVGHARLLWLERDASNDAAAPIVPGRVDLQTAAEGISPFPHADEAEARCCVLLLGESTPVIFDG